jgi:hypothetical protein
MNPPEIGTITVIEQRQKKRDLRKVGISTDHHAGLFGACVVTHD